MLRYNLFRAYSTTATTSAAKYDSLHVSVLPKETLEMWSPITRTCATEPRYFVDGTTGFGGHSEMLLKSNPNARLLCIDRDPETLRAASERLDAFRDRIEFCHGSYKDIKQHLNAAGFPSQVSGILLDLGANSQHFDSPDRGFSVMREGPLDMRYDQETQGQRTAADIVNQMSEVELTGIFREFGQERYAKEAAKAIVRFRNRGEREFSTTNELRDCLERVLSKWKGRKKKGGIHPATQCFQALRIAVNDELNHVSFGLKECVESLAPEGRLAVISFHSLEDRPTKQLFRELAKPKAGKRKFKVISKSAIKPTAEEIAQNPRARSAVLRCIEKNID